MALDEVTINFNYQRAIGQARELEEIASNLSGLAASDFEIVMNSISRNWKGENADKYLKKGDKLQTDMKNTAKSLRSVASEIRRIAQNIYNTEMKNLAIARQREYYNSYTK